MTLNKDQYISTDEGTLQSSKNLKRAIRQDSKNKTGTFGG